MFGFKSKKVKKIRGTKRIQPIMKEICWCFYYSATKE